MITVACNDDGPDMDTVEQGVKDALENRMNGRAGVDIKKLKIIIWKIQFWWIL